MPAAKFKNRHGKCRLETAKASHPVTHHGMGNVSKQIENLRRDKNPFALTILGLTALAVTAAIFCLAPELAGRYVACRSEGCYERLTWESRLALIPGGLSAFIGAYLLAPQFARVSNSLRAQWRSAYSAIAVVVTCAALSVFILHFGNRQFGAWDFSILIDTGWRQLIGQRPYTDFICTNPPGFNLGVKYAFELLGANWNAQLYAAAAFTCGTLIWLYWMLRTLVESRIPAIFMALSIECATMLLLAFWWYNDITSVTAAIFFLSCVLYRERPQSVGSQTSYVASLALLGLMKPNVAGLLAPGAVFFLFFATPRKKRLIFLTLVAVAITIVLLLTNDINIRAMLDSYAAAAVERGKFSMFGLRGYHLRDPLVLRLIVCLFALLTPVVWWIPRVRGVLRQRNLHAIAGEALFVMAPLVSGYAIMTNGEFKDVEWALLLAAGAVVVFRYSGNAGRLRRFYIAFIFALMLSDMWMGAARQRVRSVGVFYNASESGSITHQPFFKDLKANARFPSVLGQIDGAISMNPRPIFFGPRIEFAYATFGLPSPRNLPLYWQPGTSFAASQEPKLLQVWRNHRFATLIFLKNDFTFYSPAFLQLIKKQYSRDDRYTELTIFHARDQK